jgi:hypothetical protein
MEFQVNLNLVSNLLITNLLENDFQFINTDKLAIDKECFELKQVFCEELDSFIKHNRHDGGLVLDGAFFRLQECQYYPYSFIDLATFYFNNYFCESYNISEDIHLKFNAENFVENYNNRILSWNSVFSRVEKRPMIQSIIQIKNYK